MSDKGISLFLQKLFSGIFSPRIGFSIIGVSVAEQLAVFGRIVIQAGHRQRGCITIQGFGIHRLVSLLQAAFAVPAVAGVMFVPEGVIDRQRELLFPVVLMQRIRSNGRSRHPADIGKDIGLFHKVLPVCRLMSAYDGRVILRLEPLYAVMVRHTLDVQLPAVKALELASQGVNELRGYVILHPVSLEGREDGVIGAQFIQEAVSDHLRVYALCQAFGRRQIEQAQRLIKDAPLYLCGDVYVFVIDGPETVRQGFGAEGDGQLV